MSHAIYTVGHSTRSIDEFCRLLQSCRVTAVADVRSQPFSRLNPQFNRDSLEQRLQSDHLAYSFLGQELGARSSDASCYLYGRVQYDRLAQTQGFRMGLDRLISGMHKHRLAILCSEKFPLSCHRSILIGRRLAAEGVSVAHIIDQDQMQTHHDLEEDLLQNFFLDTPDLFRGRSERLALAYSLQEERIAYEQPRDPVGAQA